MEADNEIIVQRILTGIGTNRITNWLAMCDCGHKFSKDSKSLESILRQMVKAQDGESCIDNKDGQHRFFLRDMNTNRRLGLLEGKEWVSEANLRP